MKKQKTLAIFDFDGTITTKDSMIEFFLFAQKKSNTSTKISFLINTFKYIPIYVLLKLGFMSNSKAKLLLYFTFFKNVKKNKFNKLCYEYSKTINTILNKKIYNKFLEHKNKNHRVIVVSASISSYLKYWCKAQKVELLCTKLKFDKKSTFLNKYRYKKKYKNCYGKEKLKRIKKHINSKKLKKYKNIYSYGDSSSDKYILSIANYPIKV